jgi:hypothetical protein
MRGGVLVSFQCSAPRVVASDAGRIYLSTVEG